VRSVQQVTTAHPVLLEPLLLVPLDTIQLGEQVLALNAHLELLVQDLLRSAPVQMVFTQMQELVLALFVLQGITVLQELRLVAQVVIISGLKIVPTKDVQLSITVSPGCLPCHARLAIYQI
jgi:hypothetical protein